MESYPVTDDYKMSNGGLRRWSCVELTNPTVALARGVWNINVVPQPTPLFSYTIPVIIEKTAEARLKSEHYSKRNFIKVRLIVYASLVAVLNSLLSGQIFGCEILSIFEQENHTNFRDTQPFEAMYRLPTS